LFSQRRPRTTYIANGAASKAGCSIGDVSANDCCAVVTSFHQYDTIRYDTKEEFNVDSISQKLSDQLNLAHVARKKYEKEETKTNKRQCPLTSVKGLISVKPVRKE